MNDRKRIMDCVQMAHNAVTDASLESEKPFSYADQIAVMTDSLISSGVIIPVRCGDCKRWKRNGPKGVCGWCEAWEEMRYHDYFCNFGERKNED